MSGKPVSVDHIRRIRNYRVKLCQSALLKDGNTTCLFSGIMEPGESGDEYAVALGKNGHVVICSITKGKMVVFGKQQQHTTLLHLLCESRMPLLQFLLRRYQRKTKSVFKGLLKSTEDGRYDVVTTYLVNNFADLAYIRDNKDKTPLDRLIQMFGSSDQCLQQWVAVFRQLTAVGDRDDPSNNSCFVHSVIKKLCQIKLMQRECYENCTCKSGLFQTLWYINREMVEAKSFVCAATSGNYDIMFLLLRIEATLSMSSLVITEIAPNEGASAPEPIIVFLIKSLSNHSKDKERDLLGIIEILVKREDIDINKQDDEGLNAVFYAALYRFREIFHFLLNLPEYRADWRNDRNESLYELFLWSNIASSNPGAFIAVQKIALQSRVLLQSVSSFENISLKVDSPTLLRETSKDQEEETDQEIFRKKITDNFPRLCEDMQPDGKCLDVLIQRGIFPWNKIDSLDSEKTRHNRARRVLTLVLRSGKKGREALLEALRQSEQDHLVELLEMDRTQSYKTLSPDSSVDRLHFKNSLEDSSSTRKATCDLPVSHELSFDHNTYMCSSDVFLEGNPVCSWVSQSSDRSNMLSTSGPETIVDV
ncbi:uncharacterized protein LOC135471121 [Liolophura sinensis]|uniref:uncharacterized protein LOC135471121 n=1 Tax=Liolophura sinensis TaxID=3198878 RepID=UPI0031582D55